MAVETVARIVIRMLQDQEFAESVERDPGPGLASYEDALTEQEWESLSIRVAPDDIEPLNATPRVGVWRYLAQNIDEIPTDVREELNQALAERAAVSAAIPVTGE